MRRLLQKLFHKSGKKIKSSATKNTNLQKPIKEVTFAEQVFSIKTGDTNNHINDTLPKDGVYEPWVSKYVVLASKFYGEDKDAIDIGANVGIIALGLAGLQKKASIIAFEPLSFAYSQLCKNIVRNKYSNITAEQMIVADEDTQESYIHVPIREAMSSSFISAQRHMEDSRHTEKIPSIRLDTYLSYKTNTFDIKIIKIDVESAERSVLTGAENTIHKYQPVVFLEFNVQNRSLEFERKGYLLYQKVASLFQFIYLIDRVSQQLFRITNYSELRGMMLAGHFVEDLLCFNDDSFAHFLKEYIKDASYRSYHAANANLHKISQGLQVFLSHYPDNWCN
ncbi:MAG: FkbM family methyltransferase, partial [Spirochaetota bacterium]